MPLHKLILFVIHTSSFPPELLATAFENKQTNKKKKKKKEAQEELLLHWQVEGHQTIIYANLQSNLSSNF